MKTKYITVLSLLLFFVAYILAAIANWTVRKFANVTYEQIVFHLNVPLEAERTLIISFLQNTLLSGMIFCFGFFLAFKLKAIYKLRILLSVLMLVASLFFVFWRLNIWSMYEERKRASQMGTFYEEHYVHPKMDMIEFPQYKKNLVIIFIESMETAYANDEYFGHNLIPNLSKLAIENVNFSHENAVGGAHQIVGAHYTQAAVIANLCGIPLRLPINPQRFHPKNGFLPGAMCISDVLQEAGYKHSFMSGMVKNYSGMDKFLQTHGETKLLDLDFYMKRDNLSVDDVEVSDYAIRDGKLFEYAKEELSQLALQKEPFVFTMMTMDTHFGTDYFDAKRCEKKYDEHFKNVVSCSDLQIYNFVKWLKEQEFYKNTTIVLLDDHLTMNSTIFDDKMLDRKILNVFINSAVKPQNEKNRNFTALDIFPTILESLGAKIKGDRLGLGVSLFADKPTIVEEGFSIEQINEKLANKSKIYNQLLFGH